MPMDRSKKVGSVPQRNADGASGKTGNALGPKHMGGPVGGRPQMRDQPKAASGVYHATGKRGNPRNLGQQMAIPLLVGKVGVAVNFDFKPYFENYGTAAGTFTSTAVPPNCTLNTTTGVLTGTPLSNASGAPIMTVLSANPTTPPASVAVSWNWIVNP